MGILRYDGGSFDAAVSVCVVGAGACGLTAAVSAAEAGASVAVFERDSTPAGSTAMTIGLICAAGTKRQQALGVEDNADLLFEDIMTATRGETDYDLVRFLADESGPTMDWLCDEAGCNFRLETNWTGYGHSALRCHATPNGTGEEIIAMLMESASEAGVNIVTRTTIKDLIVDDDQAVVGVVCQASEGEYKVKCDALVLASSGFGANKGLVTRFIPDMADALYHGSENHRGDAVLWGELLGAEMGDMGAYQGVGTHTPFGFGLPHTVMMEGGFKVNADGRRFENELDNLSRQAIDLMQQPGGVAWIVYDQRVHEKAASLFAEYRRQSDVIAEACRGETIEQLAEKAKINADGLKITFELVGNVLSSRERCQFGRIFLPDSQLKPPFFAVKVSGALYHTQGGLCIDETARVRRTGGGVFPNLFAGGGAARSVSGPAEWGYLPAMGLATAVVFGRVAGREAARHALDVEPSRLCED